MVNYLKPSLKAVCVVVMVKRALQGEESTFSPIHDCCGSAELFMSGLLQHVTHEIICV